MVCKVLQQIQEYKVLSLCNYSKKGEKIMGSNRYWVKILVVASKNAITKNWGEVAPSTKDQRLRIVEEIFLMEKLLPIFRLSEALVEKLGIWTLYKTQNGDIRMEL